jgi:hypothetical protein
MTTTLSLRKVVTPRSSPQKEDAPEPLGNHLTSSHYVDAKFDT